MARSTNKLSVGQLAPIQIKQPRQTSADDALGRSAENLRALELGSTLINLSMNENPEPPIELLQATQLWALQTAPLSTVAPARECSMLFAALIGGHLLQESDRFARALGALFIAAGVALLASGA